MCVYKHVGLCVGSEVIMFNDWCVLHDFSFS